MTLTKVINDERITLSDEEEAEVRAGWAERDDGASDRHWNIVRKDRNDKLRDSDYMTLVDVPVSGDDREEWLQYRQALRDVPQQDVLPDEVVWPDAPDA